MERPFKKVIIVGAGPSGLLLALLLSQHGIPVHLLEAESDLDGQPRAAHYGAPALIDLDRAGVLPEVKRRGIIVQTLAFRHKVEDGSAADEDGSGYALDAQMDTGCVRDLDGFDYRVHCLVLQDLDRLMLELFRDRHGGDVSWNHRVVHVGQEGGVAWCDVDTPEGRRRIEGDYVIGCDGAGSQVRRSLFGNEYPGFTWEKQIVATNTYYDFTKWNWADANMIMHPEHFFMAAKIDANGLYRITYGEKPGLTPEEILERQAWKFETILPGHPKPGEYKIVNLSPYKMHQRCAPSFRVGRVLLVADAAHLCNPWGGLGITGGFVDAGGLYDCLAGIYDGRADESILDLYSEKRIEKWKTIIDPQSQSNFRRVAYNEDPAAAAADGSDEFLTLLKAAAVDQELTKQLALGSLELRYDFTKHYKGAPEAAG